MHEWKGKRMGQIVKKGRIPRCNRLPPMPVAYLSPALSHQSYFYPSLVAVYANSRTRS
jgi:hypothetical protein